MNIRHFNGPLWAGLLYFSLLFLSALAYARAHQLPKKLQVAGATLVHDAPGSIELSVRGKGLDSKVQGYLSLDVTNRRAVVAKMPISGQAVDVAVVRDRLYVLQKDTRLKIYDLSMPAAPEPLHVVALGSNAWSMDLDESRIYISAMRREIRAFSLASNQPLFYSDTNGNSFMSLHRGRYLFVAEGLKGISVRDVSDHRDVRLLASLPLAGRTVDLALKGNYLLAASRKGGISVIDISAPAQPKLVQTLGENRLFEKLQMVGDYLYAADGSRQLEVFRMVENQLKHVFSLPLSGRVFDTLLDGKQLYLAESAHGVSLLDVGNPARPRHLGAVGTPGSPQSLAKYGDYIYAACNNQGVQIIDVRRFEPFDYLDQLDTPGMAQQVVVDGRWLYVADGDGGVQIVDRNSEHQLKVVAVLNTNGFVNCLAKAGDYLYLALRGIGLQIYDVSSSLSPRYVSQLKTAEGPFALLLRGTSVYAASHNNRKLLRIDVSDPQHPWLEDSVDLPGKPWRLAARGDDIFVAAEDAGLQVVRFGSKGGGRIIGHLSQPWPMREFSTTLGVAIRGDYAFLAQGEQGVQMVDISDPEQPEAVQLLDLEAQTLDISLSESFAIVSTRWQGYAFLDISRLDKPNLAARIYLPRVKSGFVVDGGLLYSPGHARGLNVLPLPLRASGAKVTAELSLTFPRPEYHGWYDLSLYNGRDLTSVPAVVEVR